MKMTLLMSVMSTLILILGACDSIPLPAPVQAENNAVQQDSESPAPSTQTAGGEASQEDSWEAQSNDPSAGPFGTPDPNNPRGLPPTLQLAIGTLKLDEGEYPIDAEQAEILLPLWKAARSLGQSETAAQEEIQAVLNQIEATMTDDQMDAIDDMQLNFQDMRAIAQELGIELGFGADFRDLSPEMQATIEAARESGQFPQGGFRGGPGIPGVGPGGGPGGGMGAGLSPEQRQTAVAESGGLRGANLGLNPDLLDAIIEYLEAKAP